MKNLLSLALLAGLASAASAQIWNEIPDAGDSIATANQTVGIGPLLLINGGPDFQGDDEDLFCIHIDNPALFNAQSVAGFDTQLFLFDANGNGVTFGDDTGGGLLSRLTGTFVSSPGEYYIGISRFDNDALDVGGQEIWLDTPFGLERAPDGPGAANPLAGWSGGVDLGQYSIELRGVSYCIPAPGSLALIGLGGLLVGRRRR